MIFETIISTVNSKGIVNFAPFGIRRVKNFIYVSPYVPSTTLMNLEQTRCASINYIDDASFFINCIIGKKNFKKEKCFKIKGYFLKDALSHDEVIVQSIKEDRIRPKFKCKIVNKLEHKRFEGFNRAHGSLIEACILASRVKILKKEFILKELNNLTIPIEKTAGIKEKKSWLIIKSFILDAIK